ncbi:MAG: hypothetical protein UW46_C0001G0082 [Candidatus Yanofskybacteria bacterium GW2011_GWF1_44_227]|uniref:Uncharacterized protein n=1 Tax=Candidatus Yanofskybacteria bacterium GW2011_GWE2_40_11 TaxID=1619033 RepID=A0A0G0QLY0_9BACT|nr:MAG: hypothetical protein UT69_C0013G0012 [Candidatus Yanofskybacteria bacterium GW2011_GWE1_40_10]KKR41108.1 MAG: hypothetical protein UT75_C0001G0012 [Candidatus Yanofskybacteria bacterium GW2011_GWE2_40_11]KKT15894.1 MAG: hypothetical protein UV97_C0001G0067 [Candidatus Yanofskybacteria bacterium GW2011_GWF2_43_596]KKT53592.1 MAG: hypothetical protein UW46_C0001G0082 [Candidatus Yanofskybacteria bacterium GW2011_GWF1_44_227]OGN36280.1 MAG: hypothetical protein A2241_00875 [Candidatus Yano
MFKVILSNIKTFFRYDISRTTVFELIFAFVIAILLFLKHINYFNFEIRNYILSLFLFWAFLAMQGFFIPIVREGWTIGIPGSKGPNHPGIPLHLDLESRGGFIAGRIISLRAKVMNLGANENSFEEFKGIYREFNFAFFSSIGVPVEDGKFLEGQPQAGGISLSPQKLKARASIIFNSPGEYEPITLFYKINDLKQYGGSISESMLKQKLRVSPAENWIVLRNYAITYALTLVILLLTLIQLKFI